MKHLLLFISLITTQTLYSQTFLESYKRFQEIKIIRDNQLDSLRKTEGNKILKLTKSKIKKSKKDRLTYLKEQIIQLDSVFQRYKKQTGFNFNTADSLFVVFQTGVESNLRSFIIWSGNDTISYSEEWEMIGLHNYRRKVIYQPFLDTTAKPKGYKVISDRDSLLTIAANRSCGTAQLLAKGNQVFGGASSTIIFAKRINGNYFIDECFLPPFSFVPIWRKE